MGAMSSAGPVSNTGTFNMNVQQGYLPQESSISYAGVFQKYYFKFPKTKTEKLLEPAYSFCQCKNPFTEKLEKYLGIGLLCSEDGKNKREDLNLIIVLDISGSMGDFFDCYQKNIVEGKQQDIKKKIAIAKYCLNEIVKKLKENERLGIVLFDNNAVLLQPICKLKDINTEKLFQKIDEIKERGGTNMEIGYTMAFNIMKDLLENEPEAIPGNPKNHRIIFLTDAMPNIGGGEKSLLGLIHAASEKLIYTTFIGVGLDFNTDLVNAITKVKGANFFSVENENEFQRILKDEFNYIVTPICFETELMIDSNSFLIERTYGGFEDDKYDANNAKQSASLTKFETLMASDVNEKGVKGGIILVKLGEKEELKNIDKKMNLILKFKDTFGKPYELKTEIIYSLKEGQEEYENEGIRKAVLLSRYVELMKKCIREQSNKAQGKQVELKVADELKQQLVEMKKLFEKEKDILKDITLQEEIDTIDRFRFS